MKSNDSSDYIKSIYHRTKGRLFQQRSRFSDAIREYETALRESVQSPRGDCEADLLHAQLASVWDENDLAMTLPQDWIASVDRVLIQIPGECRLVRLKAAYIARTINTQEAEVFLRKSVSWNNGEKETLSYIAHLYSDSGRIWRNRKNFRRIITSRLKIRRSGLVTSWSFIPQEGSWSYRPNQFTSSWRRAWQS